MFNTSSVNVIYKIYEGESLRCEGVAPVIMVPHLINTINYTPYHIVFEQGMNTFKAMYSINHYLTAPRDEHYSVHVYRDLQAQKVLEDNRIADEANLTMARFLADNASAEDNRKFLEGLFQQSEVMFSQMLQAQEQLTAELTQRLEDENKRVDILRAQTVTQIAVDPTTIISALTSEVGKNGDVQRQVAATLPNHPDIALELIATTATLWATSYEIMDALASMAVGNPEFSDALIAHLPPGSSLAGTLTTFRD